MQAFVDIAIPAIAFLLLTAVGLDLTAVDFSRVRSRPAILVAGVIGPLITLPMLAVSLVWLLVPGPETRAGLLLIAACPIGGISNAYTSWARASTALSVSLTAISCLAAVVTIPILTSLFESLLGITLGFRAPAGTLLAQLFVMLALPVAIGIAARHRWPDQARRRRPIIQGVGLVALALLVVIVTIAQVDSFASRLAEMVRIAVLFVAGAFGTGWIAGLVLGAGRRDQFALAMEFATRNMAVATAIAVTILGRVDLAVFGTTYLMVELPMALAASTAFRRAGPAR